MTGTDHAAHSFLVFSCDIVGSTAYKQKNRHEKWKRTFLSFYREFPQQLAEACHGQDDFKFELWKGIGDELLFRCRIDSAQPAFAAVRAWLQAMDSYEKGTLQDEGLGTKGGVFLATVPSPDSECTIPRTPEVDGGSDADVGVKNSQALESRDNEKFHFDYFGPSFDTGFRIIARATRRLFTLSVEVAFILLYCEQESRQQPALFGECTPLDDIAFLGTEPLKGVWGQREYPMFALDREAADPVHVALKTLSGALSKQDLRSLCQACVSSPGWPSAIYLPRTPYEHFNKKPAVPADEGYNMEGAESNPSTTETQSAITIQALSADAPID